MSNLINKDNIKIHWIHEVTTSIKTNTYNEEFMAACRQLDIEKVKQLIDEIKLDKNSINLLNQGFYIACRNANMPLINLMLENGVYELTDGAVEACKAGHLDIVNFMIEKGAHEWWLLSQAASCGQYEICKELLKREDCAVCSETFDNAFAAGDEKMMILLLESVNDDQNKDTLFPPLSIEMEDYYILCQENDVSIIRLICEKNLIAELDWDEGLWYACRGGNINVVKYMIEKGAVDFTRGLVQALKNNYYELSMFLINRGADPEEALISSNLHCQYNTFVNLLNLGLDIDKVKHNPLVKKAIDIRNQTNKHINAIADTILNSIYCDKQIYDKNILRIITEYTPYIIEVYGVKFDCYY